MPPVTRDLEVAGADRLVGEADRAHARGADLVDRLRGDLLRDPALDLRLARGDLALAGLQHLAEDDLLDLVGVDLGALQRLLDHVAAEIGRVQRGERPAHLPERGPRGAEDHRLGHLRLSSMPGRPGRLQDPRRNASAERGYAGRRYQPTTRRRADGGRGRRARSAEVEADSRRPRTAPRTTSCPTEFAGRAGRRRREHRLQERRPCSTPERPSGCSSIGLGEREDARRRALSGSRRRSRRRRRAASRRSRSPGVCRSPARRRLGSAAATSSPARSSPPTASTASSRPRTTSGAARARAPDDRVAGAMPSRRPRRRGAPGSPPRPPTARASCSSCRPTSSPPATSPSEPRVAAAVHGALSRRGARARGDRRRGMGGLEAVSRGAPRSRS